MSFAGRQAQGIYAMSAEDHRLTSASAGIGGEALGQSDVFLQFQESLSRVAAVDRPVLFVGERGTGKELAANRLHFLSTRWQEPFVALNCAALAPGLIAAELFGHEQGAFTGADRRRRGRFEAAQGGTLLLDEIGNIPLETQEKILRAVEYGAFERVGASEPIHVDVRIIGATNADLPARAEEGAFMRDLLDRLSFEVLFVPPLRARADDILFLANHFAARMAHELCWTELPEFTDEAAAALERYTWPGNVRELKNVVERAIYRSDSPQIGPDAVVFNPFQSPFDDHYGLPNETESNPDRSAAVESTELPDKPFEEVIRDKEQALLNAALEKSRHNQRHAAALLGLTYHQFRRLYRKYKERPAS